ncbi:hypothetical protein ACEWY4_017341 [Coilia grayii]|uniref:Fibrinogen C-terminal domain-containing protein n=1 Tax=Coilia grayii TaxID=363190 RepID=A0ABD1JGK6_9TELE
MTQLKCVVLLLLPLLVQSDLNHALDCQELYSCLETLHLLTSHRKHELRVDMEDFEGNTTFAKYSTFSVGPEDDGYRLNVSDFTNGGAGDSLSVHNGMKFSTFHRDQDTWAHNCARSDVGAHWYHACHSCNPNRVYLWGPGSKFGIGVTWSTFRGKSYSLNSITVKIRPVP